MFQTAFQTTWFRTTCCWFLLGFPALGQAGQAPKDNSQPTKLVLMEHLWNEAQVNRDARSLDAMIGANFVNTEYDGAVSDRAKFLADIKDPQFNLTTLTIQDPKVSMYGDAAVVVGTYRTKGTYAGKSYEHIGRFTDTWVFVEGRWQCVASHTSLLKK
ncbi:MAG TPA: nuclear transport factor 2 family protein [Candidatus Aquilonibacter sp.]|nr:nuclear transport factor 2 family protein [Candidatus Aquilonibacter sp.]